MSIEHSLDDARGGNLLATSGDTYYVTFKVFLRACVGVYLLGAVFLGSFLPEDEGQTLQEV